MNQAPAILTIDIGTTNCKTCIFDIEGKLISRASSNYPTANYKWGGSEQDPSDWWKAIVSCVKNLLQHPTSESYEIIGISVTGHMHGLIALDNQDQPLTNCWTLLDQRSVNEAMEINEGIGANLIYERTGARVEAYTPIAKILWMKRNRSEIFSKTKIFVSVKDYIRTLLGGELVTDPIDAAGMLFYNLRNSAWDSDLIRAAGINSSQLPEIRQPWASGGKLGQPAANQLGLNAGIPLVVGAGDDVEVLGAGMARVGQAFEHLGTTGSMLICTNRFILDPNRKIEIYPHVLPEFYLIGSSTNAAGYSLDWTKQLFDLGTNNTGDILPLCYPPIKDKNLPFFLPFIKGERGLLWNDNASGAFVGLRSFHNKEDVFFSAYEGIAYSLKEILNAAENIGTQADEVISGVPFSQFSWASMRSDIYELPIVSPGTTEPTGLGAAILALINCGIFTKVEDAITKCCEIQEQILPTKENSDYFNQRYITYREIVDNYSAIFNILK
jgi:xylulokinase